MSVTVVPYNPWKEQLAVSLLDKFLGQIRESEANKKMNALLGELANPAQQDAQPLDAQANQTPVTAPGMATQLSSMPNSNPAGNSFLNEIAQAQTQQPNVTNFGNLFSLLGSKRFQSVNAAQAIANATPFLQEIAAAQEAKKKALAEQLQRERAMAYQQQYPTEQTPGNILQYLLGGVAQQAIPTDVVKSAIGELGQLGGKVVTNNLGGSIANYGYSPLTGQFSTGPTGTVTISPDQQSRERLGWGQVRQSDINSRRSAGASYHAANMAARTAANRLAFDRERLNEQRAMAAENAAKIEAILGGLDPAQADAIRLNSLGISPSLLTGNGSDITTDLATLNGLTAAGRAFDNGGGSNMAEMIAKWNPESGEMPQMPEAKPNPFADMAQEVANNIMTKYRGTRSTPTAPAIPAADTISAGGDAPLTLTQVGEGLWKDEEGNFYTAEDLMQLYEQNQ